MKNRCDFLNVTDLGVIFADTSFIDVSPGALRVSVCGYCLLREEARL